MRQVALLSFVALASCVAPQLDTASQSISVPEATDSVFWNPRINVGSDIWPAGQGITSTQIMMKKGPDSSAGPTFIAFVIWNGNFVGKIFRVHLGADGADFAGTSHNINATRVNASPDHSTSSGGNPIAGSGTPLPHPNVDGAIHYSTTFLNNVKTNAVIILNATNDFIDFTET